MFAVVTPEKIQLPTGAVVRLPGSWQGLPGAVLSGHQGFVNSASFSPDGQRIVTASSDNTARVWRVGGLDQQLTRGCDWLKDYLATHPDAQEKLKVCQKK